MDNRILIRFVIGGPARCGKTSLSSAIAASDDTCFVLGVDALFRAILRRGMVNRVTPVRTTVTHFLTRGRFQDADRSVSESPLDYTALDIETLAVTDAGEPVRAYADAIDAMAAAVGKTGWATFDLHPEFAYRRLRRLVPGLKLAVMFRDPAEAIAAVLYWRREGKPAEHSRREFRRAVVLWGLAATATLSHRDRWPDDVCILTLPRLIGDDGPVNVFGIKARGAALDGVSGGSLHFRRAEGGFVHPDGQVVAMLSQRERAEIAALLYPLARRVGLVLLADDVTPRAGLALRAYFSTLMSIARFAPQAAADLMDFLDTPFGVVRRRLSLLREAAGALLRRNGTTATPAGQAHP